jgi:hypothetical protein
MRVLAVAPAVVVGIGYLITWLHEREPPASGDSQPGLVAIVGMSATVFLLGAACAGWVCGSAWRLWRRSRRPR